MTISEDQLEQPCLDWFQSGNYEFAYGSDIAHDGDTPERSACRQVVPTGRPLTALQEINPHIPLATLEVAALTVTKPEFQVLTRNSRAFHTHLTWGFTINAGVTGGESTIWA